MNRNQLLIAGIFTMAAAAALADDQRPTALPQVPAGPTASWNGPSQQPTLTLPPVAPAQAPVAQQPAVAAGQVVSTVPGAGAPADIYGATVNRAIPFNAEQLRDLARRLDEIDAAREAVPGAAPRPVMNAFALSLEPGKSPALIRLARNHVTTLVFTDATGAPWNITKIVGGADKKMEIELSKAKDELSNMATLSPLANHLDTNISVFLEGAPAPIVMEVATNQPEVDFRVDLTIQGRGPNAKREALAKGVPQAVPVELNSALAGIIPQGASPLRIVSSGGIEVQAWTLNGHMLVRTKATLISPSPVPTRVAHSSDGVAVYELPMAPVVILSQNGQPATVELTGFPPPAVVLTKAP